MHFKSCSSGRKPEVEGKYSKGNVPLSEQMCYSVLEM